MSNTTSEAYDTETETEDETQSFDKNESKQEGDSSSSLYGSSKDSDDSTQSESPPHQRRRPSIFAIGSTSPLRIRPQGSHLAIGASSKTARTDVPSISVKSYQPKADHAKNCNPSLFIGNRPSQPSRASGMAPNKKAPPSNLTVDLSVGSNSRPKPPLFHKQKGSQELARQSPSVSGLLGNNQNKRKIGWQDNNYLHRSVRLQQKSNFPQIQNSPNYPNPRRISIRNSVYDPRYEQMGVPIDPLLRSFITKRGFGNKK